MGINTVDGSGGGMGWWACIMGPSKHVLRECMILQQVFEQPFATCVEAVFKIMLCDSHKLSFEHGLYM